MTKNINATAESKAVVEQFPALQGDLDPKLRRVKVTRAMIDGMHLALAEAEDMPRNALRIMLLLSQHTNMTARNGRCFPSPKMIREKLNLSEDAYGRAMRWLKAHGWLIEATTGELLEAGLISDEDLTETENSVLATTGCLKHVGWVWPWHFEQFDRYRNGHGDPAKIAGVDPDQPAKIAGSDLRKSQDESLHSLFLEPLRLEPLRNGTSESPSGDGPLEDIFDPVSEDNATTEPAASALTEQKKGPARGQLKPEAPSTPPDRWWLAEAEDLLDHALVNTAERVSLNTISRMWTEPNDLQSKLLQAVRWRLKKGRPAPPEPVEPTPRRKPESNIVTFPLTGTN